MSRDEHVGTVYISGSNKITPNGVKGVTVVCDPDSTRPFLTV